MSSDVAHYERLTGQTPDCTATTTLAGGETCDVRVRFDPATTGDKAATLAVSSNAADIAIALSGSGTEIDTDGDGIRDSADTDDDGDGVADTADSFPLNPAESVDTDGDGSGDNADLDDDGDGDGVADLRDAFPLDRTRSGAPPAVVPGVNAPWRLVLRTKPTVSTPTACAS